MTVMTMGVSRVDTMSNEIPSDIANAKRWLDTITEHAAKIKQRQAELAPELELMDRYLLVASLYLPITDIAIATTLSRQTVYKAIERARLKAETTKDRHGE